MTNVRIAPSRGTRIAEDKDVAQKIRMRDVLPSLEREEVVELDFTDVEIATQSFVHALISEAIRRHGDKAYDLLQFIGCTTEVREIVLTVFEYTLAAADVASRSESEHSAAAEEGGNLHRDE